VVDCATEDCFREDQQTREDPRKWQVPEVLFRSIPQPAKSASEKPTRSSEEEVEYQITNSRVTRVVVNNDKNVPLASHGANPRRADSVHME
jgi:hypothetical protein